MPRLARALVASTLALAGLANAVPGATTAVADDSRQVVLTCDGLGEAKATVTGDLAMGGRVTITDSDVVTVVGKPGFRGTDAQGREVSILPEVEGALCTGEKVSGQELSRVLPREQVTPERAHSVVHGTVVYAVSVARSALLASPQGTRVVPQALANDPAGYGPVTTIPWRSEMASYMNSRAGNMAVAYRPTGSQTIYTQYKGSATNVTASMVKASIMATVMRRAQEQGRGLTQWERDQLTPMIKLSDNAAASRLWNYVGGGPAVARVIGLMGLRSTTMGPGGYWGLTVTNAPDQVVLMDHFARANPVLNDSMRAYGRQLMTSASLWGVTAGPGTSIWLKNGWLPRADGWHVNSAGHNHYTPGSYSIAVLTHANTGLETQKATIEGASRLVYKHRNDRVTAPPAGYARGDWTGDGRADMIGVRDGALWIFPSRAGQLTAPTKLAGTAGWASVTWLGSPGDVNGDGRSDLLARFPDGRLFLYLRGANGGFTAQQVGNGWGVMTALTAHDFDGNGIPDILARDAAGLLWWYSMNRNGAITKRGQIGNGWGGMREVLLVSGFNGDRRADVIAVDQAGVLWGWPSTGSRLGDKVKLGWGWHQKQLVTVGDMGGDGWDDLVYVAPGLLRSYRTTGSTHILTVGDSPADAEGFSQLA